MVVVDVNVSFYKNQIVLEIVLIDFKHHICPS
jgi:hypothetical protein